MGVPYDLISEKVIPFSFIKTSKLFLSCDDKSLTSLAGISSI